MQRRQLITAVAFLTAMLAGGGLWLDYRRAVYDKLPVNEVVYFAIAKGEGVQQIATRLRDAGITKSVVWVALTAYWRGAAGRLKYGEYEIRPGMTVVALIDLLASGKVHQHAVTLVEGRTLAQNLAVLKSHPALVHDVGETATLMGALGALEEQPEGRFYPDTYFFTRGTTETALLRQAYAKMKTTLADEWEQREPGLPYSQPYEALIMASIVEKETAVPSERPKIAGVFMRRLQSKMRLQTDPTVIYGLGESFDGNIRRSDLERDTPYNTYTRAGLPPTPIAIPGREAIHAVLHPEPGSSLYFVAKGDGSHAFSDTLSEHQRAVERYQLHKAAQP